MWAIMTLVIMYFNFFLSRDPIETLAFLPLQIHTFYYISTHTQKNIYYVMCICNLNKVLKLTTYYLLFIIWMVGIE